ncbi:hypothetical protein P4B35_01760 [Pontiellaceae bacterium B12227]|nr:hypothetical protein [Pontiellaceae bacterium B12227]
MPLLRIGFGYSGTDHARFGRYVGVGLLGAPARPKLQTLILNVAFIRADRKSAIQGTARI